VGLIPEAMTDRIQQLPMVFDRPKVIDQLEDLAEALLDFTQLNDLVDWLENDRLVSGKRRFIVLL
jgi:Domain of unknown function (DUF4351)